MDNSIIFKKNFKSIPPVSNLFMNSCTQFFFEINSMVNNYRLKKCCHVLLFRWVQYFLSSFNTEHTPFFINNFLKKFFKYEVHGFLPNCSESCTQKQLVVVELLAIYRLFIIFSYSIF